MYLFITVFSGVQTENGTVLKKKGPRRWGPVVSGTGEEMKNNPGRSVWVIDL